MSNPERIRQILSEFGLKQEPYDDYAARSRSGEYMSSHLLADFRISPLLYYRKTQG